jgi:hypothetical protein
MSPLAFFKKSRFSRDFVGDARMDAGPCTVFLYRTRVENFGKKLVKKLFKKIYRYRWFNNLCLMCGEFNV